MADCISVWDFPRVLNAGEILELENDTTLCLLYVSMQVLL